MVDEEDPSGYFTARGFELTVDERELHAEYMAKGEGGRASFFAENQRYYCVNLLRDGAVVAGNYSHGETLDEALGRARQRYGSEQA